MWVSSGLAAQAARSPGLSSCRRSEAGVLVFPKRSTRYPGISSITPDLPSLLQSVLFTNEQDLGKHTGGGPRPGLSWGREAGWEEDRRPGGRVQGGQSDQGDAFVDIASGKALGLCCLPTPITAIISHILLFIMMTSHQVDSI